MQLWEVEDLEEISVSLSIFKQRPISGAYSPDVIFPDTTPDAFATLVSRGMTKAERDTERAKVLIRTAQSFAVKNVNTDSTIETLTGRIVSYSAKRIKGTALYDVQIRIRISNLI